MSHHYSIQAVACNVYTSHDYVSRIETGVVLIDYTKQLREFWPTIMEAWESHADKRPVIECDLVGKKVRAYASGEYIDSLSERTRETARRECARTMDAGGIMVFVMDSKNSVLQSYSFPSVSAASKRKPTQVSQRSVHPRRIRKR